MSTAKQFILVLSCGLLLCSAQDQPTAKQPSRLDLVKTLDNPILQGSLPTSYSPGSEQRAKALQKFLEGERSFYQEKLGIKLADLSLAVLSPDQWPKAVPDLPYGMPSVSRNPSVIAMPTRWEGADWGAFPKETDVDPSLVKEVTSSGGNWNQILYRGADGIATHELGHVIIARYGIDPQVHWFNEFLASYAGYAYLKEKVPEDLMANEIFWVFGLRQPHPHTSLADFESMYNRLARELPGNYGWYQSAISQRVIEVYKQRGLDFLKSVQKQFPVGASGATNDVVLDRLEQINTGWKVWAKLLEAGTPVISSRDYSQKQIQK